MTSLAVELSIDSRGPCALYIVTDSRITWGNNSNYWDAGQKAFASNASADIFGFCGDAFFPPYTLSQIISLINSGVLFAACASAEHRHDKVITVFKSAIEAGRDMPINNFSIIHGSRESEFMSSRFNVWVTQYFSDSQTWKEEEISITTANSYLVHVDGSGGKILEKFKKNWDKTSAEGTSRAALWAFCDALESKEDKFSGGSPQLVGIWRKGVARQFGFIWRGKRYLGGVEVPFGSKFDSVQWFNRQFERMDGQKNKRLSDAKKQPKP